MNSKNGLVWMNERNGMLHKPAGYRYYGCSWQGRLSQIGAALACGVGIYALLAGISLISHDITRRPPATLVEAAKYVLAGVMYAALLGGFPISMGLIVGHRFCDVGVGPDGLAVQIYFILWRVVPWDSVMAVRPPRFPRLNFYEEGIILVRDLTIWHRFMSLILLGTSFSPGIPITSYHERSQQLLQIVATHIAAEDG
jgi:hypothetical protein